MTKLGKEEIKRLSRRAYVDRKRGITKVIFGKDEWQIEFKITDGIAAKKKIATGEYELKNVTPAVVDENVLNIRKELKRVSMVIVEIYEKADVKKGFVKYDSDVTRRTNELAYYMMNISTYGLSGEEKTP